MDDGQRSLPRDPARPAIRLTRDFFALTPRWGTLTRQPCALTPDFHALTRHPHALTGHYRTLTLHYIALTRDLHRVFRPKERSK